MSEITLSTLRNPWCSFGVAKELLNLDFKDDRLLAWARAWSKRYCAIDPFMPDELMIHRYAVEQFLLNNSLISWKNAAIHLAMSESDLRKTVDCITSRGIYNEFEPWNSTPQLVRNNEIRQLTKHFDKLRNRKFFKHSKMCEMLHETIREEFNIEITPIYCATSLFLNEEEPEFATRFDSIDGTPVGERYQLWLNTGKPINLFPDICSLKTFASSPYSLELFNTEIPNEIHLNIVRKISEGLKNNE
jgi:hypothetical protein